MSQKLAIGIRLVYFRVRRVGWSHDKQMTQALMTDRQKRVMLKLFAVSAFLNHRDFRDPSAASVIRLRDETDRIFSRPLTADSRASLKTACMQVRIQPAKGAVG